MKKKLLIGILASLTLVVALLLLIPTFYSVDDARPEIVKSINEQISGEVSIEKLSLRLFPSLRFRIKGLKGQQKGYQPASWLDVESVDVDIALWSLLTGPKAKLVVHGPKISALKGANGKFNFEEFLAPKKSATSAAAESATTGAGAPSSEAAASFDPKAVLAGLPGWVRALIYSARFSLLIDRGSLDFSDPTLLGKTDHVNFSDMKLAFKNIGLDTPMLLDSTVGFDVQFGDVVLKGPFEGSGTLQVLPVSKGIKLKLDLDQSLDKTDLKFSNLFKKSAGRALGAKFSGEITTADGALNVDLTGFEARLDQSRLSGHLKLHNFSALSMGDLDLKLDSNDLDLAGFGVLVPMVASYQLEGKTDVALSALGSPLDPALLLTIQLKNVGGSTPELKRPLRNLSGKIVISGTAKNPTIILGPLNMGLGSSDISTNLTARGLKPTRVEASLNSSLLDVDELLGLQALKLDAKATEKEKAAAVAAAKAAKKAKPVPLDESLVALEPVIQDALKNPALDLAELDFKARINDLLLLGATFSGIQTGLSYRQRTLKVEGAKLSAYGGQLVAGLQLGLRDAFTYSMNSTLSGVDFGDVLQTHMPTWKETLTGIMTGSANLAGRGVSKIDLEKNLRGAFKGQIVGGSFKLPLAKVVETLADSMPKMSKTAKSAGINTSKMGKGDAKGKFQTMELDAKIVGREIVLDNLDVEYDPKEFGGRVEFKAKGTVEFDQKINLTGIIMIDRKILKFEEAEAFVGKSGLAEIPVKIKGTIDQPMPDYTYTAGFIGKKLLQDKAVGVAADQIRKLVGDKKASAIGEIMKKPNKKSLKKLKNLFK
jgi:hypothetical protein